MCDGHKPDRPSLNQPSRLGRSRNNQPTAPRSQVSPVVADQGRENAAALAEREQRQSEGALAGAGRSKKEQPAFAINRKRTRRPSRRKSGKLHDKPGSRAVGMGVAGPRSSLLRRAVFDWAVHGPNASAMRFDDLA